MTIDKLSLEAQRTFIGLWTYADDHGRGKDEPRLIKAAIWPLRDEHTSQHVDNDLKEIAGLNLIHRYRVDGIRYFQILGWGEHQRVNRPSDSRIPLPPTLPDGSPRSQGNLTDNSDTSHGTLAENSLPERKGTRELGKGKEEIHASLTEGKTQLLNGELHRLIEGQWVKA